MLRDFDDDDPDFEESDWQPESDSLLIYPCPYCKEEITDETVMCPYCENYISEEDSREKPFPLWIMATAIVLLILIAVGSFWI